jgi:two-component system response regulator FlrC
MVYKSILVLDDDKALLQAIVETLEIAGFHATGFVNPQAALESIPNHDYGMIITDFNLGPHINGLEFAQRILKISSNIPILMITAFGTIPDAVLAIKLGIVDYVLKPFVPEQLVAAAHKYCIKSHVNMENKDIIANDNAMKKVLAVAKTVATKNITILLTGASGTGKEVLAKFIHQYSNCTGDFIAVNCAAIPENMLEAMLFGFEKGAFTNAMQTTVGKFELANNGTIFLDEIGELSISLQAKILRVLQEQEVERLGGKKTIVLSCRVIAATNKDLAQMVKLGTFREDLFFRLNVFPLHLPTLQERPEDLMPLAKFLLEKYILKFNVNNLTFSPEALNKIKAYQWPGNVREMENIIQRAVALAQHEVIDASDLEISLSDAAFSGSMLKNDELKKILETLKLYDGNRSKSASVLGISERTLRNKIAQLRSMGEEV